MKFIIFCLAVCFSVAVSGQSKKELIDEVSKLKKEIEQIKNPKADTSTINKKAGYAMGVYFASTLKAQGGDSLDLAMIQTAMKDVYLGRPLLIGREQAGPILQNYMTKAMEKKRAKVKDDNAAWLVANKTKAGVITTASGLQYKIIKTGTGKTPTISDVVVVNYRGTTIEGVEFDKSGSEGYQTKLTAVITGWTEALQLMHEGDKWMLYIPSELAYGERGSGPNIPPYSTLIFELELLKVN